VVVTGTFGFNDVLIASECITVVHVTEAHDQLVHYEVVGLLLTVDVLCHFLDNLVVACTVGKLKLVINLDVRRNYAR